MAEENVNELFQQYKETGDKSVRNKIAEKYLYIAEILAKKFVGRGVEYDDLKQVASMALLRGIDRFDPSMGMQFTTFITPTITGEIKNYFRDKSRIVKLPRRLSEISAAVRTFTSEYENTHGVKPSIREIAKKLSLSEEEVVRALEVGGHRFPRRRGEFGRRRQRTFAVRAHPRQRRQIRAAGNKRRLAFGYEGFIGNGAGADQVSLCGRIIPERNGAATGRVADVRFENGKKTSLKASGKFTGFRIRAAAKIFSAVF